MLRGSGGFELHETERVSGRVGVDPVGFVLEHDTFPERDRAQGAHPLIGDLEVVDPHIQVKLLRWPLVRTMFISWPTGVSTPGFVAGLRLSRGFPSRAEQPSRTVSARPYDEWAIRSSVRFT